MQKNPFVRILFIANYIKGSNAQGKLPSIPAIQQAFNSEFGENLTDKTIGQDIKDLRNFFDAPLEYDEKQKGWHYTQENWFMPSIIVNKDNLLHLGMLNQLLNQYTNTPLADELQKTFNKIMLNPNKAGSLALAERITVIPHPLPLIDSAIFRTVLQSFNEKFSCQIGYQSYQSYNERVIDPYQLVYHNENWYTVAYCHLRQEIRTFNLSRIQTAEITPNSFEIAKDFKIENYIDVELGMWNENYVGNKLYKVVVETPFDNFTIQKQYHRKQVVTPQEDGTLHISFETNQLIEVLRLVLNPANNLTALEPPELIQMIKRYKRKL